MAHESPTTLLELGHRYFCCTALVTIERSGLARGGSSGCNPYGAGRSARRGRVTWLRTQSWWVPSRLERTRTDIHIGLRRGELSEASDALQRARWSGLESWPAVEPNEVHGPLLVYTGTRDGNVARKLQHQRASIEATGGKLHVLEGLNHIELLTANGPVSDVVMPFIRAAA